MNRLDKVSLSSFAGGTSCETWHAFAGGLVVFGGIFGFIGGGPFGAAAGASLGTLGASVVEIASGCAQEFDNQHGL